MMVEIILYNKINTNVLTLQTMFEVVACTNANIHLYLLIYINIF